MNDTDSDKLKRLIVAIYLFRENGTYRDLANSDGTRKMNAKEYSKLMSVFVDIEKDLGYDCGLMNANARINSSLNRTTGIAHPNCNYLAPMNGIFDKCGWVNPVLEDRN